MRVTFPVTKKRMLISAAIGAGAAALFALTRTSGDPPETVPAVDLERYAGKWFEIARLPNLFQRKCVSDVSAVYELLSPGRIGVTNTCLAGDGTWKITSGYARPANASNSKLKVVFFRPFRGNYWVLALDPDYAWAVIGEPTRKFLWFLSRTPAISAETFEQLLAIARARGYDVTRIEKTRQSSASQS